MTVFREQYGVIYPRFWEGTTGRALQGKGRDAVILALYLSSCRHANMLGLYELPLEFLDRELKVMRGKNHQHILDAFVALEEVSFAQYDLATESVWVLEMARIRLGLELGDVIDPNDKRHKAALRIYATMKPNPFLGPFFDRYAKMLRLPDGRLGPPREGPLEGLRRGSKGASYSTGTSTKTGTASRSGQGHVQVQKSSAAKTHAAGHALQDDNNSPDSNVEVITQIVLKDVIAVAGTRDLLELTEATKERCARLHVAYDSSTVRKAIDSALVRLEKRPH